jgi:hypothetical protein
MYILMFYDAKTACIPLGWDEIVSQYDTLPRGTERRYFRGAAGLDSIQSLRRCGSLSEAFFSLSPALTLADLKQRARALEIVGFGDYFLLKWADLLANVFLFPISFHQLPRMLPGPPLKCIKTYFPDQTIWDAMEEIVSWIDDLDDPFSGTRKCGFSEAETIACAIPSYLYKHRYAMGDDIKKYRNELENYPELQALLP